MISTLGGLPRGGGGVVGGGSIDVVAGGVVGEGDASEVGGADPGCTGVDGNEVGAGPGLAVHATSASRRTAEATARRVGRRQGGPTRRPSAGRVIRRALSDSRCGTASTPGYARRHERTGLLAH